MLVANGKMPVGAECRVIAEANGLVQATHTELSSVPRSQELLEGPVRGLELFTQGHLVLHGSCLNIGGRIVSLVGNSGAGKSTLAATLCQRGAALVSDGMTPVDPDSLLVAPGPARTKLNDESLRLLGQVPSQFGLVHPESLKHYYPVAGAESEAKLNLVLIVEDSEETAISPIAGAESLMKLITNVYLVEHLPTEHSPILMQRAAKLIQNGVQVKALRRVREPGRLIETVECIERAVRELI